MLSRTADHLYWMARYTERAENLARLLDVTYRMSLQMHASSVGYWGAALGITGLEAAYKAKYGEKIEAASVLRFMAVDLDNSSSLLASLKSARENCHAVRGTVTSEVWETINTTWLEARTSAAQLTQGAIQGSDLTKYFEWVKFRSHLSRGVTVGTMLQDESFHFIRLGTFLERADNTARILDVKYDELAPEDTTNNEYYEWGALLRSVSAFEIYRKVYRDVITPNRVAELLILREDMPRSLHACLKEVHQILGMVANARSRETQRIAGMAYSELRYGRIDDILEVGVHDYLTKFLDSIAGLGNRIAQDFLVPMS
jgi:uncharacterized alpha-E superfamily protein